MKTALNLFEKELNDQERESISDFEKNLEHIYQNVFSKNKNSFSAGSLVTYKSRVAKVLSDYAKYGSDPVSMANWSPKVINRTRLKKKSGVEQNHPNEEKSTTQSIAVESVDVSVYSFDFLGGVKLFIPKTQRTTEAIMDGSLKEIKDGLKLFAESFCVSAEENQNS